VEVCIDVANRLSEKGEFEDIGILLLLLLLLLHMGYRTMYVCMYVCMCMCYLGGYVSE
jgi:hypothetical protein